MTEIEICDVYEGAYLLVQGHELKRLCRRTGEQQATFVFAGDGVSSDAADFRCGRATVNVALYLFTLGKLKDQLFAVLRRAGR